MTASNILQNPSASEPQTIPGQPRQGAYLPPSPSYPAGGASAGPNVPFGTSGAFVPQAGQMTLSQDVFDYLWEGQIDPLTYWVPWDTLVVPDPEGNTPAFNPDGLGSLTLPVLGSAPPPGPTWPGFQVVIPGIYKVYAYIAMTFVGAGPYNPAIFDVFINKVPILFPHGAATIFSDTSFSNTNATGNAFAQCNVEGAFDCLEGDQFFVGINDANSFGAEDNVNIVAGSYFGIYRVR